MVTSVSEIDPVHALGAIESKSWGSVCSGELSLDGRSVALGGGLHSRWFRDSANSVVSRGLSTEVTQQQCSVSSGGCHLMA